MTKPPEDKLSEEVIDIYNSNIMYADSKVEKLISLIHTRERQARLDIVERIRNDFKHSFVTTDVELVDRFLLKLSQLEKEIITQ